MRWNPVKWKVEHEVIVLMHVNGISGKEIAKRMGKTEVHITNIINCAKGKAVIERIRDNLPYKDIQDRYRRIVEKGAERLESFINDDQLFQAHPMNAVDRAMRAIELLEKGRVEKTGVVNNNTLVLASSDNINKLLGAIDRSNEVTEMHRLKVVNE